MVARCLDTDVRPQLLVEDFNLLLLIDIELLLETLLEYVVDKSANFSLFVIRCPRPTLAFFDHSQPSCYFIQLFLLVMTDLTRD